MEVLRTGRVDIREDEGVSVSVPPSPRPQPTRSFPSSDYRASSLSTDDMCRVSRDLTQLSQLGHFLKGSSATLGLTKVKDSCEKIQNLGSHLDATGNKPEPSDDVCLKRIEQILAQLEDDYRKVEELLRDYYGESK